MTFNRRYSNTFPEEVWQMIHQCLSLCPNAERIEKEATRRGLKSLRLVSRSHERSASQILFRNIKLYPHIKSFEIALSIANSRRLQQCVKSITYDARFRNLPLSLWTLFLPGQAEEFDQEYFASHLLPCRQQVNEVYKQRLVSWQTDLTANLLQLSFFEDLLSQLPALNVIKVTHDVKSPSSINPIPISWADIPNFYEKLLPILEHMPLEQLGGSTDTLTDIRCIQTILSASRKLSTPLQLFVYEGIKWVSEFSVSDMFRYSNHFSYVLHNLKSMSLTGDAWEGDSQPRFGARVEAGEDDMIENLQDMLKFADNLHTLELGLRYHGNVDAYFLSRWPLEDMYGECKSVFDVEEWWSRPAIPPRLTWSDKLVNLTLAGLVCKQDEFISVLNVCASSLRSLTLSNTLIVPDSRDSSMGCLVKLIRWMSANLTLEKINFQRYITNGGLQRFTIRPDPSPSCLKSQIERYIIHGGECPLDHVKVTDHWHDFALEQRPADWTGVPQMLRDEKYHGDSSWNMRVDDRDETDDDDLELTLGATFPDVEEDFDFLSA